jgi:hypothetical protein
MIASVLTCFSFASIYVGFVQGFHVINANRENLRATQILAERTEIVRLYTWNQLTNTTYIPKTFTEYFHPTAAKGKQGAVYAGKVTVRNTSLSEGYTNDLREVVIDLSWTSGSKKHQRTVTTLVAHYGLQNYLYTQK